MGPFLDALAFAHDRGFVHRDLKPGNLLVAGAGGSEAVTLADFGLARAYQASQMSGLTLAGAAGGTPPFMPPEQILDMRSVKPAADQYAAAATLYWLLTKQYVHDATGATADWFVKVLDQDAVPIRSRRADLPERLAAVIHKGLSRKPEGRYADVRAFAAALRGA